MSLNNYRALLTKLGENVGLPDLAPDEDNYCCLGFDDKIIVHLQYNEENEVLMLFGQLGEIKEEWAEQLYPRILKANMFWQGTGGATLGVDDETREIMMSYQIGIRFLDFPKFQELLEGFINTAELWINTLEAVQSGQEILPIGTEEQQAAGNQPKGGIRA